MESDEVNVSCPALARLFFQFALFWRIGRALKLHTIAVGIGNGHNGRAVRDRLVIHYSAFWPIRVGTRATPHCD